MVIHFPNLGAACSSHAGGTNEVHTLTGGYIRPSMGSNGFVTGTYARGDPPVYGVNRFFNPTCQE